jgi:uncharacterized protein
MMLLGFSVGNYRSFKETVTFSMVAAKLKAKDQSLDEENVFNAAGDLNLLKSAAIYGANASGKSNFIQALTFMRSFILNSSKETQVEEFINVEPFRLAVETETKPSFFEIVFMLEGKKYRYGFEVNFRQIVSEWLFYSPTTKEAKLFTRDESGVSFSNNFKEGKGIVEKTRDNALFLSVVAQFNGQIALQVLGWFRKLGIMSALLDSRNRAYTLARLQEKDSKLEIIRLIKSLDLGIDDIELEQVKPLNPVGQKGLFGDLNKSSVRDYFFIRTLHRKTDSEGRQVSTETFDLDENESDGTRKLFSLSGSLVDVLKKGEILVIDELDARLHPLITCTIIRLFNSNETNPNNAQLIFTTHDTNLLSNTIFRRDQIWFAEKNKQGATSLYSLAEFKVRNDASFEKDYIQGRYGAIPFIGDFSKLMGKSNG